MTWTKPIVKTARVSNQDLSAMFYFGDDDVLRMRLLISNEDGTSSAADVVVGDVLTAGEKAGLITALVSLRDAALAEAGYSEVP